VRRDADGQGSRGLRATKVILRLYPRAWRTRYEEEVGELVAEQGLGLRGALDLVRGAWDAHRHLGELLGWDLPSRLRRSALVVLGTWAAFMVAGGGMVKVWDDPSFSSAAQNHVAMGWIVWVIMGALAASVVAMGIGALPVAAAVARRAWLRNDARALGLLCLPPCAAIAFLLSGWALGRVRPLGAMPSLDHALFLLWIAFDLALVVLCFLSVRKVVARYEVPLRLWCWTSRAALVVSSLVSLGGVALLAYVVSLAYLAPDLYHSRDGLIATPLPYTLLPIVVVALVAGAAAVRAAADGWRTLPASSSQT
jgi:hypothetical protein